MPTPRVQFNIPHSPIANPKDLSSSTIQNTPQTPSQQITSNIPSDYLGSTPTSEQIRENPFNPPATTEHPPFWMTQAFSQGEPNLVNDPKDVSSDTTLSLPETFSPSTPSLTQISQTPFLPKLPTNLDARYKENSTNNRHLRLHNWALNRLQYRQDIHKDIQERNIQVLTQDNLTLKFEITVKLNEIIHHP